MKILNSKIIKISLVAIFILIASAIFTNNYGYQIHTIVTRKENLDTSGYENFPDMLYRKQVSAHSSLVNEYDSGKYSAYKDGKRMGSWTLFRW